jgi:hypothetical protein
MPNLVRGLAPTLQDVSFEAVAVRCDVQMLTAPVGLKCILGGWFRLLLPGAARLSYKRAVAQCPQRSRSCMAKVTTVLVLSRGSCIM